jgi:hypothetical protein
MGSLPTLNSLQLALLNDDNSEDELMSVVCHLLVCAIEDPGIPHPQRHTTILGQSLKQADITPANLSEVLKIYLTANANGEVKGAMGVPLDRKDVLVEKTEAFQKRLNANAIYKLSLLLKEKPFLALNPTDKSAIVAFICHELLQNKAVVRQVEDSIDNLNTARKEKWLTEGHLRKLKQVYQRKYKNAFKRTASTVSFCTSLDESNMSNVSGTSETTKDADENEEEEDDESGNESDQTEDFGSDAVSCNRK